MRKPKLPVKNILALIGVAILCVLFMLEWITVSDQIMHIFKPIGMLPDDVPILGKYAWSEDETRITFFRGARTIQGTHGDWYWMEAQGGPTHLGKLKPARARPALGMVFESDGYPDGEIHWLYVKDRLSGETRRVYPPVVIETMDCSRLWLPIPPLRQVKVMVSSSAQVPISATVLLDADHEMSSEYEQAKAFTLSPGEKSTLILVVPLKMQGAFTARIGPHGAPDSLVRCSPAASADFRFVLPVAAVAGIFILPWMKSRQMRYIWLIILLITLGIISWCGIQLWLSPRTV